MIINSVVTNIQQGSNNTSVWKTTSNNSEVITAEGNHFAVRPSNAMAVPMTDNSEVITTRANLYDIFIIITKVCLTASESGARHILGWVQSGVYGVMPETRISNAVATQIGAETGTLTLNEWYYYVCLNNKTTGKTKYFLFRNDGTLQGQNELATTSTGNTSSYLILGGCYSSSNEMLKSAKVDGDEILVKGDNTVLFGHYISPTMQTILDTITA